MAVQVAVAAGGVPLGSLSHSALTFLHICVRNLAGCSQYSYTEWA